MAGKFEILKATNGQFYFNLKAGNGEVILTSQMYQAKPGAETGIASVKENSTNDSRYERKVNTADKHYFVLKAANGQIIGTSQAYSSKTAMESGIQSVTSNAPGASTVDSSGS